MDQLRRWGRVLRFVVHKTFVEPVVEGRLKEVPEHPWPRGLRPVIVLSTALYALLALLGLFAVQLRQLPLVATSGFSMPRVVAPFIVLALMVGTSLLYCAALRVWVWLRVPLVVLVTAIIAGGPAMTTLPGRVLGGLVLLLLLAVMALRWRKPFRFAEFLFALFLSGNCMAAQLMVPHLLGIPVPEWGPLLLNYWVSMSVVMTAPAGMLAGAAMSEIIVTTGSWTARGVWEAVMVGRRAHLVGGLLLAGLVVWTLVQEGYAFATDPYRPVSQLPWAALVVLGTAVVALGVLRLVPQGRRPGIQVDPDDIAEGWRNFSWPLAVIVSVPLVSTVLVTVLNTSTGLDVQDPISFLGKFLLVVCGGGLAWAVGLARRGQPGAALVSASLASAALISQGLLALGLGTPWSSSVAVAAFLAIAVLAYLIITRRLSADRGLAIATVLLLARIYPFREKLDDPLVAILAVSGTSATLLVGLLWRQLTEYAHVRGDSRHFPNATRVLLALANMVMVAMAIAMFALTGEYGDSHLEQIESYGDSELGAALLLGSILAGLLLALRGREGGDARPGDEFDVVPFVLAEPKHTDLPGFLDQNIPRTRWRP